MIELVVLSFAKHGLKINWAMGKSAGMLKLRKGGAWSVADSLRDAEGKVWLKLPEDCPEEKLEIVNCFTHLGSKCSSMGNMVAEAKKKLQQQSLH